MGNPNEFFTDDERGSDTAEPPNVLVESVFSQFWENYEDNLENKKSEVISNIIRPAQEKVIEEKKKFLEEKIEKLKIKWLILLIKFNIILRIY